MKFSLIKLGASRKRPFAPHRAAGPWRFPWKAVLSGLAVMAAAFLVWRMLLLIGARNPLTNLLSALVLTAGSVSAVLVSTLIGLGEAKYTSLLAEASRIRSRIDNILETITESFLTLDPQWRVTYLNSHAEEKLGVKSQEVLGRTLWRYLSPAIRETIHQRLSTALHRQTPVHFEIRGLAHRDRWCEVNAYPSEDGLSIYIQDISDRKQGEEFLRHERDFSSAVLNTAGNLVLVLDRHGRIVRFNRACELNTGYTAGEVIGHPVWDFFILPEDATDVMAVFQELLAGHFPNTHENVWLTRDGGRRLIDWSNTCLVDESGDVEYIISAGSDITERTAAAEALRESEERFRATFEQAAVGIAQVGLDGRWLSVNEMMHEITGYSVGELRGKTFQDITYPEDIPGDLENANRLLSGELDHYHLEKRYVRPDGSLIWVNLTVTLVRDAAAQPKYYIAVVEDISKRKAAEERLLEQARQLAEADHRKDEFLAMLAHELRNPLAPIRNAVQVLRLVGSPDPAAQRQKEIIDRQVAHMARLLDDLLDVSRITRGKIKLRKERLDLRAVIESAIDISRPATGEHGLELHAALPAEPLWVAGDLTRLEQILRNLITNAIKYTERGGRIWVEAQLENHTAPPAAVVRVRDTGVGIPREILPRIFDLFAQADQSLDRSQGGLGIGLTLVRRLVELHGGCVEAASDGPGCGSQFLIRLPLLDADIAASGAAPLPAAFERPGDLLEPHRNGNDHRTLKVLLVDDNVDSVQSLTELLRIWGYPVRVAYDGAAALELAASYQPDIVLLDIGLPGMNGYEVAGKLRELDFMRRAVLVALTGYGQAEDRRKSRDAGFDRHFTKPINLQELRVLLGQCAIHRPAA